MANIVRATSALNRVPEVTLAFWVIKIMSTTVGETGADYLAVHVGLGTAVTGAIMASLLVLSLILQFRMRYYVPWIYWLTVVLVSVVGTQITDALTDQFGISLYVSTFAFAALLVATFAIWYASERTLSIHTIVTMRRELFYWTAILFTFALGTAAGDLATEALGLGFNLGVVVFGAMIAAIAFAYHFAPTRFSPFGWPTFSHAHSGHRSAICCRRRRSTVAWAWARSTRASAFLSSSAPSS